MKFKSDDTSKKARVQRMFDDIAPHYDSLNHTLSLNIDKLWRRKTVRCVAACNPRRILDLATGTGDLAIAMAKAIPAAEITGMDISTEMLAVGRKKVADKALAERITLQEGDAEHLPFGEAAFDVETVAFGVRNFGDLAAGLREMHRTLRPGGHAVILEFSRPKNRLFRAVYEFYSYRILPRIGGLVSRNRGAYEYLPASIGEFPAPEAFMEMMRTAGFSECRARSCSFGIAQIYTGVKKQG